MRDYSFGEDVDSAGNRSLTVAALTRAVGTVRERLPEAFHHSPYSSRKASSGSMVLVRRAGK
jgi:hypothetical protein